MDWIIQRSSCPSVVGRSVVKRKIGVGGMSYGAGIALLLSGNGSGGMYIRRKEDVLIVCSPSIHM